MTTSNRSSSKNAVVLLLAVLCGCDKMLPITEAPTHTEDDCVFRTGDLDRSYCRASIYKLVVNPERFVGKPIYTVGYIEKGSDGGMGLAPTPAVFEADDMDSCVVVSDYVLGRNEVAKRFLDEGLYAVRIAGDFSSPVRGLCAGRLSNAVISDIRLIKKY